MDQNIGQTSIFHPHVRLFMGKQKLTTQPFKGPVPNPFQEPAVPVHPCGRSDGGRPAHSSSQ